MSDSDTNTYLISRDATVGATVEVDKTGTVINVEGVSVATLDNFEIYRDEGFPEEVSDFDGIEWPEGMPYAVCANASLQLPATPDSSAGGLWALAINSVLSDRDAEARISADDIDDDVWQRFIGPMIDYFEDRS